MISSYHIYNKPSASLYSRKHLVPGLLLIYAVQFNRPLLLLTYQSLVFRLHFFWSRFCPQVVIPDFLLLSIFCTVILAYSYIYFSLEWLKTSGKNSAYTSLFCQFKCYAQPARSCQDVSISSSAFNSVHVDKNRTMV